MFDLGCIIGLKVTAIKGFETDRRKTKYISPKFILFDDEETYIELEDQDYYSYHDCSTSAKHIRIYKKIRECGK
jgi:hypothetical protein